MTRSVWTTGRIFGHGPSVARIFSMLREERPGLDAAGEALRRGGIVIFPTETFYGLAADPRSTVALERLVALKSRLPAKPVPLIACDQAACAAVAVIPPLLEPLCAAFWPGPLTLVLEPRDASAWHVSIVGEGKTLGVRVSSHPVALALAGACGGLVTSTSANFASLAPVTTCDALDPALVDAVDVVLDAGALTGGLASTVLRMGPLGVDILRAGAVSLEQIERVVRA